jgi:hypothetical protein
MKTGLFASIAVSTFFYTALLFTMFVMPFVLASRQELLVGTRAAQQTPHRYLDGPQYRQEFRELRIPQTDVPLSVPALRQRPMDKASPDAAIINRPGKMRSKSVKA